MITCAQACCSRVRPSTAASSCTQAHKVGCFPIAIAHEFRGGNVKVFTCQTAFPAIAASPARNVPASSKVSRIAVDAGVFFLDSEHKRMITGSLRPSRRSGDQAHKVDYSPALRNKGAQRIVRAGAAWRARVVRRRAHRSRPEGAGTAVRLGPFRRTLCCCAPGTPRACVISRVNPPRPRV